MERERGRPPSVDAVARALSDTALPRPLLVEAARAAVAAGDPDSARHRAEATARLLLQPVLNATGVLLHTNLGRAPLSVQHDGRPTNLELDLETGRRGSRAAPLALLLRLLTGAEDAVVVNNGAAALLLALTALGPGAAVVSRGELVEIGGGFRLPEIVGTSGMALVEVGTTNRTRLSDYATALAGLTPSTPAVVLKVHQSNFRLSGFTASTTVEELAGLGVPVVADIGSGLLDTTTPWLDRPPPPWLAGEPAARQSLAAGASLVTFSGDKLLGGPQAGIVAGRAELVARCARHPLARALRPGGLVLGALQAVLLAYLRRDGAGLPFWRMATVPVEDLARRAEAITEAVPGSRVVSCSSAAGGGALPDVAIPSVGVAVRGDRTTRLRRHSPPVVATVRDGTTVCDLRGIEPEDDKLLAHALAAAGDIGTRADA